MKKTTTFTFAHLLLWLVCATLPLGFTACSDDEDPTTEQSAEPEPEPEPDADYTVMLYGCGGGNLDDVITLPTLMLTLPGIFIRIVAIMPEQVK